MKKLKHHGLYLIMALMGSTGSAWAQAQHDHKGMDMANKTLFVAQLDAEQVATGSASKATGTGAFQLDPTQRTLEYRLTYQGLESGGPLGIALYNFGRGKNAGKAIYVLCGNLRKPCPANTSATISGKFDRNDAPGLTNDLVGEFDSERIYVEVIGGDGNPEIRGQLAPNDAIVMVENFVAELAPVDRNSSKASGTAVLSKTYLPDGKVSVTYAATVAGTSDAPKSAVLSRSKTQRNKDLTLPKIATRYSRDNRVGGSMTGSYDADVNAPEALPGGSSTTPGQDEAGIVITTAQRPDGELYGALVPVQ